MRLARRVLSNASVEQRCRNQRRGVQEPTGTHPAGWERRLGRSASEEEVADSLGLELDKFNVLINQVRGISLVNLEEVRGTKSDGDRAGTFADIIEDVHSENPFGPCYPRLRSRSQPVHGYLLYRMSRAGSTGSWTRSPLRRSYPERRRKRIRPRPGSTGPEPPAQHGSGQAYASRRGNAQCWRNRPSHPMDPPGSQLKDIGSYS